MPDEGSRTKIEMMSSFLRSVGCMAIAVLAVLAGATYAWHESSTRTKKLETNIEKLAVALKAVSGEQRPNAPGREQGGAELPKRPASETPEIDPRS